MLKPTEAITVDFSKYYTPKPKQALAHRETAKYCLFGGALGGGKSWYLCAEAITHAMKWSGARCVIVRKERSVMVETIWITFTQICPPELIAKIDNKRLAVKLINGSEIRFLAVDISKDPILNKIKGLEISWFGLDEANELDEKVFTMLKTRLRWKLADGTVPRYEGRLTSNPENCWLIPVFIESDDPHHKYIQSLTSDNYDIDSEYYQILEQAFKNDPILKQKYLLGDWGLIDKINQLFPGKNLLSAKAPIIDGLGTGLGVDVARFGSDESVWCHIEEGNINFLQGKKGLTIPQVVDETKRLIDLFKLDPMSVGVDGVGMGAGVVDYLHTAGYQVMDIVGGAAIDPGIDTGLFKPYNLRSQMFWVTRQDIIEGRLGNLAGDDSEEYKKLQRQLTWIEYVIQGDKTMKVVGKDQIKKVHGGKSPDYPDALVYANWVKKARNMYELSLPLMGG